MNDDERYVIRFTDTGKFNRGVGYEAEGLTNASFYYTEEEAVIAAGALMPPYEVLPVSSLLPKTNEEDNEDVTTAEAAAILAIANEETIKNWLHGGHFPGSYQDNTGAWRFPLSDVREAKAFCENIRDLNARGDLSPPDCNDDLYETASGMVESLKGN